MHGFSNLPIEKDALPALEHLSFSALASRYRQALFLERAVGCAILLIAAIGVVAYFDADRLASVALGVVWLVFAVIWLGLVPWVFRAKGWLVRDHDISSRSGVLTRRLSTVPFARVQNVSVRQSLRDRLFEIATLDVFTAGADLHISGLAVDDAERLRLLVLERAGVDESESAPNRPEQ